MADTQRVFTREVNNKKYTRVTDNPSQIVKFVFDGWTELTGAEATKAISAANRDAQAAEKATEKATAAAEKAADAKK